MTLIRVRETHDIVGIVGCEEIKFTPYAKDYALAMIDDILWRHRAKFLCSGHCHLGGIDIWAEEVARRIGGIDVETHIYPPKNHTWQAGYKPRNIAIAARSGIVYNIVVDKYPEEYGEERFEGCYHCKWHEKSHVKSGGCWTMIRARQMGKEGKLEIVPNYPGKL